MRDIREQESLDFYAKGGYKDARDEAILRHEVLVERVARRFEGQGVSWEDLVQEGHVGLIRAVDSFNVNRDTDFEYYAWTKIHDSMQKAVIRSWGIRLPRVTLNLMFRWHEVTRTLRREHGKMPSDSQVAREMGIRSAKQLKAVYKALHVYRCLRRRKPVKHLTRQDQHKDNDLAEMLPHLAEMLSHLDDRTRRVLEMRFGLGTGEPKSLKQVGDVLGCSYENVRKIEKKGISQLRRDFDDPADG